MVKNDWIPQITKAYILSIRLIGKILKVKNNKILFKNNATHNAIITNIISTTNDNFYCAKNNHCSCTQLNRHKGISKNQLLQLTGVRK